VIERTAVLHDAERDRDVPLRAYIPNAPGPFPLVVFSHGIGESRDAYRYFGLGVASRGYAVVHLQHAGTDAEVLKRGYLNLYRETKKPENWRNRPFDLTFVLDEILGGRSGIAELDGRVDPETIAVAGHSAGAFTAMAMAGTILGDSTEARDPRVRAAIALSMPRLDGVLRENAFTRIAVPVLHVTGRRDSSIIYRTRPHHRRIAFDRTTARDQYLVTLARGTHATFSNVWNARKRRQTDEQRLVLEFSVAFLDTYLRSDPRARQWLDSSGERLRDVARVEQK
jgi:predicted dienelactone hydrolase